MSITDINPQHTIDDRKPLEQLRASELREIAWAEGLPCSGQATKAEILPLLESNRIVLTPELARRAMENKEKRLREHFEAVQKGRKAPANVAAHVAEKVPANLHQMKWFELVKLAAQHEIDVDAVAPKGETGRADKLAQAIREKIKNG